MNTTPNDFNQRVRNAVKATDVPPELEAAIRRRISASPERSAWLNWAWANWAMPALAAAALAVVAVGISVWRPETEDQATFLGRMSAQVSNIMRVGLGDHIHCAFFRKFPAQAPAVQEMEQTLGKSFKDLIPVVRQQLPDRYKLVLGHRCRFDGREFVHLSLKDGDQLLSLLITAKNGAESFDIQGALPAAVQAGVPVYAGQAGEFQIAGFETSRHLVYFVSNVTGQSNREMLAAMVPSIKAMLERIAA